MKTTYHEDHETKTMNHFPGVLKGIIQKYYDETGKGFFCSGEYDENEIEFQRQEGGWTVTDGEKLKSEVSNYWEPFRSILHTWGDDVERTYNEWVKH